MLKGTPTFPGPTSQRPHFTGDGHTMLKEVKDLVLLGLWTCRVGRPLTLSGLNWHSTRHLRLGASCRFCLVPVGSHPRPNPGSRETK